MKGDVKTKISEIINITKSMPVAKVQLVEPGSGKATRVGYKIEGGKKIRVSKKTGKEIGLVEEAKVTKPKVDKKKKTKSKADEKKKTKKKAVKKKTDNKTKTTKK